MITMGWFNCRVGSLYQFIGEMEKDWDKSTVQLSPKVYRCVDGLNTQLYHKVRQLRDKTVPSAPQMDHHK